jgi:hypothetical protein
VTALVMVKHASKTFIGLVVLYGSNNRNVPHNIKKIKLITNMSEACRPEFLILDIF